jgi:hypothetical protein
MVGDGVFKAVDGGGHAEHEEGIVQLAGVWIEEGVGVGGGGDAASEKELGEDLREVSRFSESRGLFSARLG